MYPELIIDTKNLKRNAELIKKLCDENKVSLCAVIKVFHADPTCLKVLYDVGIKEVASSRIKQIKIAKDNFPDLKTLLIRIPMISELEDVIEYVDTTLITEYKTLNKLNELAKKAGKIQNVIVMQDLGDLREGIIDSDKLIEFASYVEELSNIHLLGLGTNLTCYGSIRPTETNLSILLNTKEKIEEIIDRKLEVVSGGATTSTELLFKHNMPEGVNHLRIGGLFTTPNYIKEFLDWKEYIDIRNVYSIKAEIIELSDKPTYPIGEIVVDGFGNKITYIDRGIRKRAIVALGRNDVGSYLQLYPKDEKLSIVGGSSDHTIVDIEDSENYYEVGNILEFELDYESIMFAMQSDYLNRKYI